MTSPKALVQSKKEGKDQESINQVPHLTQYTTCESDFDQKLLQ